MGFHRRTARARPAETALNDPISLGEILFHGPEGKGARKRHIGIAAIGMQHGVSGRAARFFKIDDCGQRFIFDFNQIAGVFRDVAGLRHNRDDGFANMANLVLGDTVLMHRRISPTGQRAGNLRSFFPGHYAQNACQRLGFAFIDSQDSGMGMRASQDGRVGHLRQICVVGKHAASHEEPRVLDPLHVLADILV